MEEIILDPLEEKKKEGNLLNLCVNVIAENFDRFMLAYKSGNHEHHYHFEIYLQKERKISILLLKKLIRTDKFEKYIDFVLNPYIGEIQLNATFLNITPILERLKEIAPTITSLFLPDSDYANSSLPELVCSLTKMESMTVHGQNISAETFRNIGKHCQNLKSLTVLYEGETAGYIEALCASNNKLSEGLQYLYLYCDISIENIKCVLKHFHGLLYLDHDKVTKAIYEVHANDIHNLSNLRIYNLQALMFHDAEEYPAEFLELCGKLFPHLKTLYVCHLYSQAHVEALKSFPFLKKISLVTVISCNLFLYLQDKGKDLKRLEIYGGTISLNSLINSCPNLEYLQLSNCVPAIINDDLTSKSSLKYCKGLSVDYFDFRDDLHKQFVWCLLSHCPFLQSLTFHAHNGDGVNFTKFIQMITSSVKCIKTLKRIRFVQTNIELPVLKYFIENTSNLENISLSENNLTVNDVKYLKNLKPSVFYDNCEFLNEWGINEFLNEWDF